MVLQLEGKTVLITGGANGIGSHVVRYLAEEGVKNITILDPDINAGTQIQNEINTKLGKEVVKYLQCDVSVETQLFEAFKKAVDDNEYIDIVINNAGLADESNTEAIRKTIEVNYMALVNSTLKALDLMRKDRGGKGGTILNVSSIASLCQISPSLFVYLGTKSAVMQFSNCIGKKEYSSKTGVTVITVCFGTTNTGILDKIRSFDEEINEKQEDLKNLFPRQSPESAARGLIEALKNGESGTTWLVDNDKPAKNITESVTKAYQIMTDEMSC